MLNGLVAGLSLLIIRELTGDIIGSGMRPVGTSETGDAVLAELQ
jgi:hypothetical protein